MKTRTNAVEDSRAAVRALQQITPELGMSRLLPHRLGRNSADVAKAITDGLDKDGAQTLADLLAFAVELIRKARAEGGTP